MPTTLTTIKIAASNSSTDDKAAAYLTCGASTAAADINGVMNADNLHLLFANGTYNIETPVLVRSGCVLEGSSVNGVVFACNNTTAVSKTSAAATTHEYVLIDSITINVGTHDDLACDFRGFFRSQFNRLNIQSFALGVWFGGDLPTYLTCWTNVMSRFHIGNCLVGVLLSGFDTNGNSTANNITLTEGEIICRDAAGGIAINAIEAQFTVEKCDIGYGNASAGIVIGAHADNTRIVNSRFEWDSQTS